MVIVVFGLPGSGKSYLARLLSDKINAVYINSDRVRPEMLTSKSYSEQEKQLVYNEMKRRMTDLLHKNTNVVLDATFYKNDIRNKFINEAENSGSIEFIEVVAEEKVIMERLKTPRPESDANFEIYKKIKEQWEPLQRPHLVLESGNDNINEMLDKAVTYLHLNK